MNRVATMMLWLGACGGSSSVDSAFPLPGKTTEALQMALEDRGIVVAAGQVRWDAIEDCCTWGTCLHVNPNGEYGTYAIPPGPGEYTDDRNIREDGTLLAGRIGADEGLLYVGPPPAGATYSSFRTYQHDIAIESGRAPYFGNLGDTLNMDAWQVNDDGTLLVLTTGHAGMRDAVREAAEATGWPEVNLDILPADTVQLGLNESADTFHTTVRIVGLHDPSAFESWRDGGQHQLWRLTPVQEWSADPLPAAPVRIPLAESDPGLESAVDALREAILASNAGQEAQEAELTLSEPPMDEPSCWPGCNRDVSYVTTPAVPLLEGQSIVVYGVDPVQLGRATWTEIVMVGTTNNDAGGGVGSVDLVGTAEAWVPEEPDADKLFAWTFARDCGGQPACTEVPTGCPGLDYAELGKLAWRHYLDPVTQTFPPLSGLGGRGAIKFIGPAGTETTDSSTTNSGDTATGTP